MNNNWDLPIKFKQITDQMLHLDFHIVSFYKTIFAWNVLDWYENDIKLYYDILIK